MTIRTDMHGKRQGIDILSQGDLLGIVQLYNENYSSSISILPLTAVSGCMLSSDSMDALLRENNEIATALIAHFAQRFARVIAHLSIHSMGNSKEKLDYALSITAALNIKKITHEQLAILTGLNRVTVTKTIKDVDDYSVINLQENLK